MKTGMTSRVFSATGWFLLAMVWTMVSRNEVLAGGERVNVRGMGMARTFDATSRGLDAVGVNPANLGFPDQGTVTMSLVPFGLHFGSDVFTYGLYTNYFTGVPTDSGRVARYLDESDKRNILDAFRDGVGETRADAEVRLFGLSICLGELGTVALTATEQFQAYVDMPKDYAQFLLEGNTPGSTLDFSKTDLKAAWVREYAITFGRQFKGFSIFRTFAAGLGVKLVHGYGYYELERFNTSLTTATNGTLTGTVGFQTRLSGAELFRNSDNARYSPFPAPAGTGFGVDVGVAGALNEYLSVGFSITDIGSITWDSDNQKTSVDTTMVIDDPVTVAKSNSVENALNGKQQAIGSFSTSLPTTLRLGFAMEVHKLFVHMPGELLIGFDYNQGLVRTAGSVTTSRVSLGAEYRLVHWFPIRTGISLGGTDHFNYAFGFGFNLGVFDLDLASENISLLLAPKNFSYGSVAVGMRVRI